MKEWERQEKELAKRRRGRRTSGSGAGWVRKGDVHEDHIMWEAKQTSGVSISIKKVWWTTLRKNALMDGKMPALAVRIQDLDLVVISRADFDTAFPPQEV